MTVAQLRTFVTPRLYMQRTFTELEAAYRALTETRERLNSQSNSPIDRYHEPVLFIQAIILSEGILTNDLEKFLAEKPNTEFDPLMDDILLRTARWANCESDQTPSQIWDEIIPKS